MSSPIASTPAPTVLEKAEKALPTVIDDINEKLVDVRQKACARKSLVLDSKFVQKAKLQAKRLVDRSKGSSSPADDKSASGENAEDAAVEPTDADADADAEPASALIPESIHVSFQTPLAGQLQQYEQLVAININAIFKQSLDNAQAQVQQELAKWSQLIHDEAKLSA